MGSHVQCIANITVLVQSIVVKFEYPIVTVITIGYAVEGEL